MTIRVINTAANNGAYNMAVDEAILTVGTPTLRFYTFSPPAITIGKFQKLNDNGFPEGMDIVRRLTGGRAVMHRGDLTYSLVVPIESELGKKAFEVYKRVGEMFKTGLNLINIPAKLVKSKLNPNYVKKVSCFSASARYELQVNGKKIVGSAQRVQDGMILQQGSLFIDSNENEFQQLGLNQIMNRKFEIENTISAIKEGFIETGINVVEGRLINKEIELVNKLMPKYLINYPVL